MNLDFDLHDPRLRRRLSIGTVVVSVVLIAILVLTAQTRDEPHSGATVTTPSTPDITAPTTGDGSPTTFGTLPTSEPPTSTPEDAEKNAKVCTSATLALQAAVDTGRAGRAGVIHDVALNARIYLEAMRNMTPLLSGKSQQQALVLVASVSSALDELEGDPGPSDPRAFYAEVERKNLAISTSLFRSLAEICPGLRKV